MKLLICTQTVDLEDSVLGFFHIWIKEFATKFEHIDVICLKKGKYDLPKNVSVYSLGKEKRQSRFLYILNFYKYIWMLRKDYDSVFVHMNQEYVLLGGFLWRFFGKRVSMWRNHYAGNFLTDLASIFCNKVFCTSKFSYTAKYKKTTLMPVGIDTNIFVPNPNVTRIPNSILFLSRIAPSKKIEVFLKAIKILKDSNIDYIATIVGDPLPQNKDYYQSLKKYAEENNLKVCFEKGVANTNTRNFYQANQIFVNTSPSGMYDKTIFEAMSCECLAMTSNENLREITPSVLIFREGDSQELAEKIKTLLKMNNSEVIDLQHELRSLVMGKHSLDLLKEKIFSEM